MDITHDRWFSALSDNWVGTFAITSGLPTALQEPSTLVLAALGLAGPGLVVWRKRRRG